MPGVLKWLSLKLNCSSQIASLLAATSTSDVELVRGIINANPELGLYNTQGGLTGGRSALTIAAERGDLDILQILYEGAVKARGEAFAKQSLNAGAERGQTPLMRACMYGGSAPHISCVKYLLITGSDPFAETDKGETCLHIAAKNAHTDCLTEILSATVSIGGSPPVRLADAVLPYTPPIRFINMRNEAGFTALHLATLKNSPASMQVLLGAGASLEAGILDAGNTPMLARGSTALHIAAARGSFACCTVLLDFQLAHPECDIRRIRNSRNLKASQLARLGGHDQLAEVLRAPRGSDAAQQSRTRSRRRRRGQRASTGNQDTHQSHRPSITPEAVMDILIARTQLLLALREVGLELGIRELPKEGLASVQAAHPMPNPEEPSASGRARDEVASAVAEFTNLWQQGKLEESESGGLLTSLIPADLQVAKLPDSIFGDNESGTSDSYAAAALVQAALNAMAHFSQSAKPLDLPPTELKPTSPLAAAVVVQVAIRKLAGKKTKQNTTSAATLISSMHHSSLMASPGSGTEQRQSDTSKGARKRRSLPVSGGKGDRRGSSSSRAAHHTPTRHRDESSSAEVSRVQVQADASGGQQDTVQSSSAGVDEPSPYSSSRRIRISRRSSVEPESIASTVTSPLAALTLGDPEVAELPGAVPTEASLSAAFENDSMLPDDPDAMPMWEGYELGEKGLEDEENDSEGTQLSQVDRQNGSPKSSTVKDQKQLLPPSSPPRNVPTKWREEKTDESTSVGSMGSILSVKHPRAPSSKPSRSIAFTPTSPSSASCLTPADSGLLATHQTSVTETDSDKEEEDENEEFSETEALGTDIVNRCAICMDQPLHCAVSPCSHKICYGCAYQLCSRGLNIPSCPFCRGQITTFISSNLADSLAQATADS